MNKNILVIAIVAVIAIAGFAVYTLMQQNNSLGDDALTTFSNKIDTNVKQIINGANETTVVSVKIPDNVLDMVANGAKITISYNSTNGVTDLVLDYSSQSVFSQIIIGGYLMRDTGPRDMNLFRQGSNLTIMFNSA